MLALKARPLRITEADRGKDGKLVSGNHSAHAREHMLAASIAMNTGDHDEAFRRIDSARIHTCHSMHAKADDAGKMLEDAMTLLKNGNAEKANSKVDAAYGAMQGEPNKLLQMKKQRESAPMKRGSLIETLTFHPRFVEGSYDPVKRTVDVLIFMRAWVTRATSTTTRSHPSSWPSKTKSSKVSKSTPIILLSLMM